MESRKYRCLFLEENGPLRWKKVANTIETPSLRILGDRHRCREDPPAGAGGDGAAHARQGGLKALFFHISHGAKAGFVGSGRVGSAPVPLPRAFFYFLVSTNFFFLTSLDVSRPSRRKIPAEI